MNKKIIILIVLVIAILIGLSDATLFKSSLTKNYVSKIISISAKNQGTPTDRLSVIKKQWSCQEIAQLLRDKKIEHFVESVESYRPDPDSQYTISRPTIVIGLNDGTSFSTDPACVKAAFNECGTSCKNTIIPVTVP